MKAMLPRKGLSKNWSFDGVSKKEYVRRTKKLSRDVAAKGLAGAPQDFRLSS